MTTSRLPAVLAAVLLGAASLTAAAASSAAATSPKPVAQPEKSDDSQAIGGSGWIAYESTSYRIRLVRTDGSGDHALDDLTYGPEDNPDWSPDGRWLTFVGEGSKQSSAPGLWVINANGRGLRRLAACVGACQYLDDPAWSPDGRSIAYSRQAPDAAHGGSLEMVDVSTGRTRTLLTAVPGDFYAGVRWSPDGTSMVLEWVHASPANYEDVTAVDLARFDLADPSTLFELSEPGTFPQTADWAPSGQYISFAALSNPDAQATDIYVIRPDGTQRTRLTTLDGFGGVHTDFTNDSAGVYFVEFTTTGPQLRLIDLATRTVTPVGAPAITGFHPRSRPGAAHGMPVVP